MPRTPITFTLALALCLLGGCDQAQVDDSAEAPEQMGPDQDARVASAKPDVSVSEPEEPEPTDVHFELTEPVGAELGDRWGYMVADRGDGTALLIGGTDASESGEPYDYDGHDYIDVWHVDARVMPPVLTPIPTDAGPSPRYNGCAGWDPIQGKAVVVGGRNLHGLEFFETWLLDPAEGKWTMAPQTFRGPHHPVGCAMAWSDHQNALYMFGGAYGGHLSDEIWSFDADAHVWHHLRTEDGPRPRYDAALIPHGDHELLMVGGAGVRHPERRDLPQDMWAFDVRTRRWREITPTTDMPPGRRTPWVTLGDGGFYMGFGVQGLTPGDALDDLWWFDDATGAWEAVELDEAPTPRGFAPCLPGGPGALGVLLGGFDLVAPDAQLWMLKRDR